MSNRYFNFQSLLDLILFPKFFFERYAETKSTEDDRKTERQEDIDIKTKR